MSEFMREALPIFFMYGVVGLLGPLVGLTMWMALDGDRLRDEADSAAAKPTVAPDDASTQAMPAAEQPTRRPITGATSAA
jgi:hypothetical protein